MVTILLATFNGERYLAQQLESILEQDEQNITIEICDDGSVDGTVEIIKKFQELYPEKVKWMEKEKPSKSAKENFFYMLSKAKDSDLPYVMLADQDDLWLPNKVSTMFGRMKKMEERYGSEMPILVHANLALTDENLNIIHSNMAEFMGQLPHQKSLRYRLVENTVTGNSMMINGALLRAYQEPMDCVMHDWWLALVAAAIGRVSYIEEPLTLYRQHATNAMGAKKPLSWDLLSTYLDQRKVYQRNYQFMFAQARSLLQIYGKRMPEKKKEIVEEFVRLEGLGRIEKIQSILHHRFFKSKPILTIGQMLNI